jgi:ATP-binding cassette subfamily F protein 3
MEIRKVQRLNELDLDKSGVKAVPVAEKKQTPASDFEAAEKKKQQAQIQLQIKKAEEQIERLESEIKELDSKLAVPASYEELTKNPNFFNVYDKLKKDLEFEMQKWEDLSSRLI